MSVTSSWERRRRDSRALAASRMASEVVDVMSLTSAMDLVISSLVADCSSLAVAMVRTSSAVCSTISRISLSDSPDLLENSVALAIFCTACST